MDLPAPDGPTMATFSPARMRTETSWSVGGSPGENPKLTSVSSTAPRSRPGSALPDGSGGVVSTSSSRSRWFPRYWSWLTVSSSDSSGDMNRPWSARNEANVPSVMRCATTASPPTRNTSAVPSPCSRTVAWLAWIASFRRSSAPFTRPVIR